MKPNLHAVVGISGPNYLTRRTCHNPQQQNERARLLRKVYFLTWTRDSARLAVRAAEHSYPHSHLLWAPTPGNVLGVNVWETLPACPTLHQRLLPVKAFKLSTCNELPFAALQCGRNSGKWASVSIQRDTWSPASIETFSPQFLLRVVQACGRVAETNLGRERSPFPVQAAWARRPAVLGFLNASPAAAQQSSRLCKTTPRYTRKSMIICTRGRKREAFLSWTRDDFQSCLFPCWPLLDFPAKICFGRCK